MELSWEEVERRESLWEYSVGAAHFYVSRPRLIPTNFRVVGVSIED